MFDFLRKVPLFAELALEDLQRLCGLVRRLNLPAGGGAVRRGERGDEAYVIQEGRIEVSNAPAAGRCSWRCASRGR